MPTAAGHFPRISTQISKENLCDEIHRNKTGTAVLSASKSKQKAASSTPLKYSRSTDFDESVQASFRTPNRPESNAQSKRRSAARGSINKKLNHSEKFTLEVTPNQKECLENDVEEQLHNLRKEKSQLEAQNCNLQVNFAQVKSQLEAVLLYKEVSLQVLKTYAQISR